jgi:hypothetical protein
VAVDLVRRFEMVITIDRNNSLLGLWEDADRPSLRVVAIEGVRLDATIREAMLQDRGIKVRAIPKLGDNKRITVGQPQRAERMPLAAEKVRWPGKKDAVVS